MGSPTGLSNARRHDLAAGYEGIPGSGQLSALRPRLAAGDFDGDGYADLAIGVPAKTRPGSSDVGAEVVLYGSLFTDGFESATPASGRATFAS